MYVDGLNETASGLVTVGTDTITYPIPPILKLPNGANNATVTAFDTSRNEAKIFWTFTITPAPPPTSNPFAGVKPTTILLYIGVGAGLSGAGVGGYILFLKQTTRFTFRRYFATHPVRRTYLALYLPLAVAFVALLFGLSYVASTPGLPTNAVDYVFIFALFIALTPFGIDARQEMLRIRAYERAFAQFLFEMADAMRGGIDPAKALVELAKTHTNILSQTSAHRRRRRAPRPSVRGDSPGDGRLNAKPPDHPVSRSNRGRLADRGRDGHRRLPGREGHGRFRQNRGGAREATDAPRRGHLHCVRRAHGRPVRAPVHRPHPRVAERFLPRAGDPPERLDRRYSDPDSQAGLLDAERAIL